MGSTKRLEQEIQQAQLCEGVTHSEQCEPLRCQHADSQHGSCTQIAEGYCTAVKMISTLVSNVCDIWHAHICTDTKQRHNHMCKLHDIYAIVLGKHEAATAGYLPSACGTQVVEVCAGRMLSISHI